jgi:hypothetical protein
LSLIALLALPRLATAERPVAPKLLPERTLALLRVTDTPLLIERFRETALGRIGQDEEVKPLVSKLYATAQEFWTEIEDRVGLPLDQLLKVPQGEIALAFVAPPEQSPAVVVLLDVKDQMPQAKKLLERGEQFLTENGGSKAMEQIEGQDVAVYTGRDGNQVFLIERDGALVLVSTRDVTKFVLTAWEGRAEKTLADNNQYNSVMSRCAGAVDDPPQVTWFIDPIEGIRTVGRGGPGATFLALIPVLGLDGVKGAGGSMTFATGEFDDVQHFHILLENPRSGVLEMVALSSGDTTPESWVPADVVSYTTLHWKLDQTYDVAARLYNSLSNEGAFQDEVQRRVSDRIGVDFEKEVLPALEGRATLVQWVEKPVRLNSITTLVGVKLKDPAAFRPTLDKVLEKFAENVEKASYGGTTYWSIKVPEQPMNENGPMLRQPTPCVAILNDYLIMTDSTPALEAAIKTQSQPSTSLGNELDYKLIASKISRQQGGDAPGMVQFSRPEEGLRFWYELATSDNARNRLARGAENNRYLQQVEQALKDSPLPPFAVLAKYMAPSGGMMVSDETGLHYSTFTLRRKNGNGQ